MTDEDAPQDNEAKDEPAVSVENESAVDLGEPSASEDVAVESQSLSGGALAFVAFAMLVLVGGAIFVVGSVLSQDGQTNAAQAAAELEIAEYDPEEFVTEFSGGQAVDSEPEDIIVEPSPTTVPASVPLADDPEPAEPAVDPDAPQQGDSLLDPANTGLVFVNRTPGDEYGHVGYVTLEGERIITPLPCERLDWNRFGAVCLQSGSIGSSARGILLDAELRPTAQFSAATPSRAAVSPDGATVSWSGFVTGHDYLAAGEFSTTTQLVDTQRQLGVDLEEHFEAFEANGDTVDSIDQNYWGATFVDGERFYATIGSEGETDIVEGDVLTGELRVVFENASCPEVSPDGSTIVAKEQRDQSFQLVAIDTATGVRRDLGEARSVDDQVEWIDNTTIAYGLPNPEGGTVGQPARDIWVLNISDGSAPRLLLPFADSPAAA